MNKGTKRSKIRKGDQVVVIAGRDNGKRGRVLEVLPAKSRIKVEGVAVQKKHQRANPQNNRGGGIIDREAYIDISNVQRNNQNSRMSLGTDSNDDIQLRSNNSFLHDNVD